MSRYRWLRPSKCLETLEFLPSTKGRSPEENEEALYSAVEIGRIRAMLNDEIVPKAHIGIYCGLDQRKREVEGLPPRVLPPDLFLNYDDLLAIFDRPTIDNRKRGRPTKENSGWSEDRQLAFEMHKMLAGHPRSRRARSAAEAARILVQEGKVSGAGTPESRAKRLERVFRKYYSS